MTPTKNMIDVAVAILRSGGSIARGKQPFNRRPKCFKWVTADGAPLATSTVNALLGNGYAQTTFTTGERRVELTRAGMLLAYREWERREAERGASLTTA